MRILCWFGIHRWFYKSIQLHKPAIYFDDGKVKKAEIETIRLKRECQRCCLKQIKTGNIPWMNVESFLNLDD